MQKIKNTILIVDDEGQIRKMLSIFLDSNNFKIEESGTGAQAIRMCVSVNPDLVLLDLGLPDMDGGEVIKKVREWSQVPILILSARTADEEIVAALNMGADDYITKPFNADVLKARINANLRKKTIQETGHSELQNGPLHMDLLRHEVMLDGKKMVFTPTEYELLRYLIVNRGKMLTHKQILHAVWGAAHSEDIQYVRVYIAQVREKLERGLPGLKLITTEPGVGYRMETLGSPPPESQPATATQQHEAEAAVG